MAGITLAQAQARLDALQEAFDKVLAGQAYTLGGRSLTRVDLGSLEESIDIWNKRVISLSRGSGSRIGAHGIITS